MPCPICRKHFQVDGDGHVRPVHVPPRVVDGDADDDKKSSPKKSKDSGKNCGKDGQKSLNDSNMCSEHAKEITVYCDTCHKPGCVTCIVQKHNGHQLNEIDDFAENVLKARLKSHLPLLYDKMSRYSSMAEETETSRGNAVRHFQDLCEEISQAEEILQLRLKKQAQQLQQQLAMLKESKLQEYDRTTAEILERMENLRQTTSTCDSLVESGNMYDVAEKFQEMHEVAGILEECAFVELVNDPECSFKSLPLDKYYPSAQQNMIGNIFETREEAQENEDRKVRSWDELNELTNGATASNGVQGTSVGLGWTTDFYNILNKLGIRKLAVRR